MPLFSTEALLGENEEFQWQNVTPNEDWTQNLWFQVKHSPFQGNLACATLGIFKLLFMQHLISGLRWFI